MYKTGDVVKLTEDACVYYGNDEDYQREWGMDENDLALSLFTVLDVSRGSVHNIPHYSLEDGVVKGVISAWEFDLELAP